MTTRPRPLVSIVIVNYNGGPYLLDSVRSALASTVPIELFVVDNGSVDGSVRGLHRALAGEPRLAVIENGANLGFARANNIALARAQGEFLLLLNPDCVVEPDTVERMLGALREDPAAGMAGCLIRNPDGTEQAGCRRTIPTPWSGLMRVLHLNRFFPNIGGKHQVDLLTRPLPTHPVDVEAISGAFMLVRRSALEQVGVMDDSYFLHCEDLDWCKAFHDAGWKILFVPNVDIVHYKGACSVERPFFVLWHKHRGMVLFYRKFLSRQYSMPLNLLVIMGVWLRFAAMVPMEWLRSLRRRARAVPRQMVGAGARQPDLPLLDGLRGAAVLVTGGTGFIGYRLVRELLRQGARVTVLTRSPAKVSALWPRGHVRVVRGDLEDPASLVHACDRTQILFHLASCAHRLDAVSEDSSRHSTITEKGTSELLRVATRAQVETFVFVSSVKAMGEESDLCLDESSPARPESPYGVAKLNAEREVLETARDSGMRAVVLRLPLVYGPGNKGNLPRMIHAIRSGRFPPLPNVLNRRSMVHVDDVVQAVLLAAVKPRADGRVYIVTDNRVYSTAEIYRLIATNLGKRLPRWVVPLGTLRVAARVGDALRRIGIRSPLHSGTVRKLLGSAWYSSEKIRTDLGFEARYDLQEALPDIIASMDAEPRGEFEGEHIPERPALDS
jgi:GT2 family glycosyltransferase/nucleoside-diphosphate-sugar epimerase